MGNAKLLWFPRSCRVISVSEDHNPPRDCFFPSVRPAFAAQDQRTKVPLIHSSPAGGPTPYRTTVSQIPSSQSEAARSLVPACPNGVLKLGTDWGQCCTHERIATTTRSHRRFVPLSFSVKAYNAFAILLQHDRNRVRQASNPSSPAL